MRSARTSGSGAPGVGDPRGGPWTPTAAPRTSGVTIGPRRRQIQYRRWWATTRAVDLDARISALQTSAARLQVLMDGAATTEALLVAEKALSERQEQLEPLQSQRAGLADQVELSTLSVHLEPFGVAPAGGPEGFLDGLGTGWRALVTVGGAAVVVLGILLPWMAVAALVAASVLVPIRLARRRAAVAAPPPAQE